MKVAWVLLLLFVIGAGKADPASGAGTGEGVSAKPAATKGNKGSRQAGKKKGRAPAKKTAAKKRTSKSHGKAQQLPVTFVIKRGNPVSVLDGERFVWNKRVVRLKDIETPPKGALGHIAAKQRLEEMLKSGDVEVVPHSWGKDGEMLCEVKVNNRDVAGILRAEGFQVQEY